jgi:hypothetical protein
MSEKDMSFIDLARPFPEKDIEWRVGRSGITGSNKPWIVPLAYLTARAVMDRLDTVCGPDLWQDDYKIETYPDNDGVPKLLFECRISINCGGEWITKTDAAQPTDFEPIKGGYSDAFKRAAVKWGIGRYLYHLENSFAEISMEKKPRELGWRREFVKDKKTANNATVYWKPPALPDWALPQNSDLR